MKQTAVEWLQSEIDNKDMGEIPMWIYEFIEQAKAMEKEQIENAFIYGQIDLGMEYDNMNKEDRLKMAESAGSELRKLIHTYTGLDMHKLV